MTTSIKMSREQETNLLDQFLEDYLAFLLIRLIILKQNKSLL